MLRLEIWNPSLGKKYPHHIKFKSVRVAFISSVNRSKYFTSEKVKCLCRCCKLTWNWELIGVHWRLSNATIHFLFRKSMSHKSLHFAEAFWGNITTSLNSTILSLKFCCCSGLDIGYWPCWAFHLPTCSCSCEQ